MRILVESKGGCLGEWSILELQGSLSGDLQGQLGEFRLENGRPTLKIGNQLLIGQLERLPRRILVLDRANGLRAVARVANKAVFKDRPAPSR